MKNVKELNTLMCRAENLFNSIILVIVLVVISAQVIARYVFNHPLIWSEELSRYLYVWIAWIGCAFCVGTRSHVRVPVIFDHCPARVQNVFTVVGNLVIAGVLCYLFPYSMKYALGQNGFMASTMPVTRLWLYLPLPIGVGLSVAQLMLDTLICIWENRMKREGEL